ncbi:amidohydrolase family protein [Mycolicibacterium sp. BiH015]|uniref:amidohydrolase family protein n=1 Tax=Mycolicibacterium sp. BiH015 TaxID=3018808 RepID=UPI002FDB5C5C
MLGAERVMFSVDYPMDDNETGAQFLASYPMDDATRRKVSPENAIRLFGSRIPEELGD